MENDSGSSPKSEYCLAGPNRKGLGALPLVNLYETARVAALLREAD